MTSLSLIFWLWLTKETLPAGSLALRGFFLLFLESLVADAIALWEKL